MLKVPNSKDILPVCLSWSRFCNPLPTCVSVRLHLSWDTVRREPCWSQILQLLACFLSLPEAFGQHFRSGRQVRLCQGTRCWVRNRASKTLSLWQIPIDNGQLSHQSTGSSMCELVAPFWRTDRKKQLHYLCESDHGLNKTSQDSVRIILLGVHLLGHVVKEVPTCVKSLPQPQPCAAMLLCAEKGRGMWVVKAMDEWTKQEWNECCAVVPCQEYDASFGRAAWCSSSEGTHRPQLQLPDSELRAA